MTSILAGHSILVVEDEPLIALDVACSFETAGAQVVTAFSLDEALSLVEVRNWSGAVLDYWLNGQDCSPVCERLIERGIPFVMCTGDDQTVGPCTRVVRVTKPVSADELVRLLEEISDPRRKVA
jgi:DNA-binding response OmpR family regulator